MSFDCLKCDICGVITYATYATYATYVISNKWRKRPVRSANMWIPCSKCFTDALCEAKNKAYRNYFYFDVSTDRCWVMRVWNYVSSHGTSWKTGGSLRSSKKAVCWLALNLRVYTTEPILLRRSDIFISRLIYWTLWRLEPLLGIDLLLLLVHKSSVPSQCLSHTRCVSREK
jgi:hypothetical protein